MMGNSSKHIEREQDGLDNEKNQDEEEDVYAINEATSEKTKLIKETQSKAKKIYSTNDGSPAASSSQSSSSCFGISTSRSCPTCNGNK